MTLKLKNTNFIKNKSTISINEIDINKIVVSNKLPFGKQDFKYLIVYKDSGKNNPLCIFCPEVIIYERNFDNNKHIYLFNKGRKYMEYVFLKYMEILEKVSNIIKSEFNS